MFKKNLFKYLLPIIFLISTPSFAQEALVPVEAFHDILQRILSGRYTEAEELTDKFILDNPGEPAGPLFKASVLQYEYVDYEDNSRNDEFNRLLDETENLSRKKLESSPEDLWAKYYLFAASGLRGARASLSGRLFYGIIEGRSGAKGMMSIIEQDSTFYDAYLMAGSYKFWKSVASEPVLWMPLIGDERDEGISMIEKAISHGRLNGPLYNTVLIEMLLNHDLKGAMRLAEKMAELYPSCRLFSWQLGEAYKKLEQYEDAVRVFNGIAMSMMEDQKDDGSGELRCWWKLAVLSKSVGKKEECIYFCKKVIDVGKKPTVYKRQQVRIEEAQRMVKEFDSE